MPLARVAPSWLLPSRAASRPLPREIDGTRIVHLAGMYSLHLGFQRDVWVWLPPGYEQDDSRRYPVLYLHDAQNLFFPERAFMGRTWDVAATAERTILAGEAQPFLIAAMDHGNERRIDEYTPSRDWRRRRGGRGERHARFLTHEVMPAIDSTFRTDPGAAFVGGSSLGGLISLHLALTRERFAGVMAMSPSVWWDGRRILKTVRNSRNVPDLRIYVDMGTEEGDEALGGARALRNALVERGAVEGETLRYVEEHGARHEEAAWARRLGSALKFLFPVSS